MSVINSTVLRETPVYSWHCPRRWLERIKHDHFSKECIACWGDGVCAYMCGCVRVWQLTVTVTHVMGPCADSEGGLGDEGAWVCEAHVGRMVTYVWGFISSLLPSTS